jgi:hypothetical protein
MIVLPPDEKGPCSGLRLPRAGRRGMRGLGVQAVIRAPRRRIRTQLESL